MRIPKISVCIPTYNSAPYLAETLESVLAQHFGDFELIVCDDASQDHTLEICRSYSDRRLRIVESNSRRGQAGNWNRCIFAACGENVVILHADDMLHADFLRRAVSVLDAQHDVGFVHSAVEHIDERGRPLYRQVLFGEDRVDAGEAIWRRLIVEGCIVNPAGVMVRRHAYERAGLFCDKVVYGVDWHMWLRLSLQSSVGYLSEPLAAYRQHTTSATSNVYATARNGRDELWVVNDILHTVASSHPHLLNLREAAIRGVAHRTWCVAELMCRAGAMTGARAGLLRSIRTRPSILLEPRTLALWAATYLGYAWFSRSRARAERLMRMIGVRPRSGAP